MRCVSWSDPAANGACCPMISSLPNGVLRVQTSNAALSVPNDSRSDPDARPHVRAARKGSNLGPYPGRAASVKYREPPRDFLRHVSSSHNILAIQLGTLQ